MVFNELGIRPINGRSKERLNAGVENILADYPDNFVIKSVNIQ